jgi:hypothetical protein
MWWSFFKFSMQWFLVNDVKKNSALKKKIHQFIKFLAFHNGDVINHLYNTWLYIVIYDHLFLNPQASWAHFKLWE